MPICRLHPVGAGLPAMAVCQSLHPAMTLHHREASSLLQMPLTPCGSWLASDGGVSVITSDKDIAPSRGKFAPTNAAITLWELACQRWRCVSYFIRQGHCAIARQARPHKCRLHPVGAGLPAMAVCQSFHPARTLRHREASSLLHLPGAKPAPGAYPMLKRHDPRFSCVIVLPHYEQRALIVF